MPLEAAKIPHPKAEHRLPQRSEEREPDDTTQAQIDAMISEGGPVRPEDQE